MFQKNDLGEYEARVGGIRFVCDELPPDAEATASVNDNAGVISGMTPRPLC